MKKIYFILIFLITSVNSLACSCDWAGNFIVASAFSDIVVKGEVIDRTYYLNSGEEYSNYDDAIKSQLENSDKFYEIGESITIKVLDDIKGTKPPSTIKIFDSDGSDCRQNISEFKVGSVYVFSAFVSKNRKPKLPGETSNDYAISACSENWLEYHVETNNVVGLIRGTSIKKRVRKMNYFELVTQVQRQ